MVRACVTTSLEVRMVKRYMEADRLGSARSKTPTWAVVVCRMAAATQLMGLGSIPGKSWNPKPSTYTCNTVSKHPCSMGQEWHG